MPPRDALCGFVGTVRQAAGWFHPDMIIASLYFLLPFTGVHF